MIARYIILGAPRSGTSMVAGLFADAGIFTGDDLLGPTISNPRGYFESARINQLNNRLIAQLVRWPKPLEPLRCWLDLQLNRDLRAFPFASPFRFGNVDIGTVKAELTALTARSTFCFKDPRFCVTLPIWRLFTPHDTRFLVVFREPSKTIQSYLKNGRDMYDPPLVPSRRELFVAYERNYRRLLHWADADWMFIHYDQVLSAGGIRRLSDWSGLDLKSLSLDSSLRRSSSVERDRGSEAAWRVYEALCNRAGFAHPHADLRSA